MMRRDLGNEIIVAIAAVGVIAAAVVFGILLILPNSRPDPLPTQTADVTRIAQADATATTPAPTPTLTAEPTDAPPTRTPTVEASATAAYTPTPTKTATRRVSASATPRMTATHTATDVPTLTLTATRTPTLRAGITRIAIRTRTSTPTATLHPTVTAHRTTAPTAPPDSASPFPNVTPLALCAVPDDWQIYIVQSGDTLSRIARKVGSTVEALTAANCLVDANRIVTGDVLYVPRGDASAPGTPAPAATGVSLAYYGCAFGEISAITNLIPGQIVRGEITLEGTANLPRNFWFYRLELRPDYDDTFIELERVEAAVIDGTLGIIDTADYARGLYWVRLTVVDTNWRYPPANTCTIPVFFEP